MSRLVMLNFFIVMFSCGILAAEDAPPETKAQRTNASQGVQFFESKIRPVLVKHCYDCHSAKSGLAEGGLRVDDRDSLRAGGERGRAVVPKRPAASLLLTAISHTDADLKMPPKSPKLSADVIRDFKKWIETGAADPRRGTSSDQKQGWAGMEAAKTHWAYQPPRIAPAPEVADENWPRRELDRFILARLEEHKLKPTADAAPDVLFRRLYFDLIGLPPMPDDVDRFLKRCQSDGYDIALESEVDRLLESPRFGERWGRHWLDVARFGESSGKEANIPFPYAWRYRDYVIDCINQDVSYDRFLTEQLAGDLLPNATKKERARLLVATGYLAVGTKNLSEGNDKQFQADLVDEQIDSLTRGILASSVACARCHDHKFDPFAMKDYYALAGIFHSTKTYFGTFVSPASRQGGELMALPRLKDEVILHDSVTPQRFQQMKKQLQEFEAEKREIDASQRAIFSGKNPKRTFTLREVLANIWRRGPLVGKLQTLDERGKAIPVAMGAMDTGRPRDVPLLARGEISRPGETVPRGFPKALETSDSETIPADASGRLQLARWLTDPKHPLTSRVLVNRVWQKLFGAGLVRSVDNFGTTGETPSHPELLDTLAVEFVKKENWSLKKLIKKLVLSRTYRQASTFDRQSFLIDADNQFLWRMPKRRLEAEAIRDAMLAVSGELNLSRPEGSLVARAIGDKPISLIGLDQRLPKDLDGSLHRSVYLPVIRDRLPDALDLFDFPEPSLVTGVRDVTNVPVQALYLMNSPFVGVRSRGFASRLIEEAKSDKDRVRLAFRLCFSRAPDEEELARSLSFIEGAPSPPKDPQRVWESFAQALFSMAEFRNLD